MRNLIRAGVLLLVAATSLRPELATAQVGTAFTYQGRLNDGSAPANGPYDLRLRLFDSASGTEQVGSTLTLSTVNVAAGLFTVAVDFGAGMFTGSRRWLEIAVAPGGSGGPWTTLSPRQELTPVANAVFSATTGDPSVQRRTVAPTCSVGQYVRSIAPDGTPTCAADIDTNSGGTVTSVGSGAGLAGGPVTGVGSLSIATGGVSSEMIANGAIVNSKIASGAVGAAQIDATQVQTRLATMCPGGQFLRGVNADGSIVCETFNLPPTITVVDDPSNDVIAYTSIAIGTDGLPVISYYDDSISALKVAKCVTPACTGTSTITVVDDPPNIVGPYSSIAIGSDGLPVVSYLNTNAGTLKVAKCVNAACTGASTITTLDTPPGPLYGYTSIAIGTDGFPVISYQDGFGFTLKVAKCTNASCTGSGTTFTLLDDPESTGAGEYNSIAIGADGFPVISHIRAFGGTSSLNVAKCVSADCAGPTVNNTVDTSMGVSGPTSIAIGTDGLPVISYRAAGAVKVAKCTNPACSGTSIITSVGVGILGGDRSLAIGADGFPVISYQGGTPGSLKVAKCANATCGASTIATVDNDPTGIGLGQFSAIAIGRDGSPVISYFDNTAYSLRVAKCNKASCAP